MNPLQRLGLALCFLSFIVAYTAALLGVVQVIIYGDIVWEVIKPTILTFGVSGFILGVGVAITLMKKRG